VVEEEKGFGGWDRLRTKGGRPRPCGSAKIPPRLPHRTIHNFGNIFAADSLLGLFKEKLAPGWADSPRKGPGGQTIIDFRIGWETTRYVPLRGLGDELTKLFGPSRSVQNLGFWPGAVSLCSAGGGRMLDTRKENGSTPLGEGSSRWTGNLRDGKNTVGDADEGRNGGV